MWLGRGALDKKTAPDDGSGKSTCMSDSEERLTDSLIAIDWLIRHSGDRRSTVLQSDKTKLVSC